MKYTKQEIEGALRTALALVEEAEDAAEEGCRLITGEGGPSVARVLADLLERAGLLATAADMLLALSEIRAATTSWSTRKDQRAAVEFSYTIANKAIQTAKGGK